MAFVYLSDTTLHCLVFCSWAWLGMTYNLAVLVGTCRSPAKGGTAWEDGVTKEVRIRPKETR